MKKTLRGFVASGLVVAATAFASSAFAVTFVTPNGPMDSSCVHRMPPGASFDSQAGEVRSASGDLVAKYGPCAVTRPLPAGSSPSAGSIGQPRLPAEWYATEYSYAVPMSGMTQYDEMDVSFSVPANPAPPNNDTPLIYLFPALNGTGTDLPLAQPVLQWGYNNIFGGNYWVMAAWYLWGPLGNEQQLVSSPITVYAGDVLTTNMFQWAANPDAWAIESSDCSQHGCPLTALTVFNIPNSRSKMNLAYMGAIEAYGNPGETLFLASCRNLPTPDFFGAGDLFVLQYLGQAGPSWGTDNNVTATAAWLPNHGNTGGPSCSWNEVEGTYLGYPVTVVEYENTH